MQNYNYSNIVSSQEAEALKEMIFKRARERAEALNKEVQASFTDNIQNDVMQVARDSFNATKNPFAIKNNPNIESIDTFKEKEEEEVIELEEVKDYEIGFAQRSIDEIKAQIHHRNKVSNENNSMQLITENMDNARTQLSNKKNFIGALEFLNSQATIALVKNKGKKFEALA